MMNRRLAIILTAGSACAASFVAGCGDNNQAAKSVQQVEEAPGVYGQAINRAKSVAGTEEQHASKDYLNRQTGGGLDGDSTGGK